MFKNVTQQQIETTAKAVAAVAALIGAVGYFIRSVKK